MSPLNLTYSSQGMYTGYSKKVIQNGKTGIITFRTFELWEQTHNRPESPHVIDQLKSTHNIAHQHSLSFNIWNKKKNV